MHSYPAGSQGNPPFSQSSATCRHRWRQAGLSRRATVPRHAYLPQSHGVSVKVTASAVGHPSGPSGACRRRLLAGLARSALGPRRASALLLRLPPRSQGVACLTGFLFLTSFLLRVGHVVLHAPTYWPQAIDEGGCNSRGPQVPGALLGGLRPGFRFCWEAPGGETARHPGWRNHSTPVR